MVVFVLFFCCTLFGPSRRRKRFTQVIGVQDDPKENENESARINESFIDDQNADGVILRVFPDYGEVQVVQKYNHYVQFLCK